MPRTNMTFIDGSLNFKSSTLSDHVAIDGHKRVVKEKNHKDSVSAVSSTCPLLGYIDSLPLVNLLELLVINHSSSKRRNIFVPRWLKLSRVMVVLQLPWVRTSPQLRWITRSDLALGLTL